MFIGFDFRINLTICTVRILVPGDRYCILYAWEIGLTASAYQILNLAISS